MLQKDKNWETGFWQSGFTDSAQGRQKLEICRLSLQLQHVEISPLWFWSEQLEICGNSNVNLWTGLPLLRYISLFLKLYFWDSRQDICELLQISIQGWWGPKDWNQSLLRRGRFLWTSVSRIANRAHLSPALFARKFFSLFVYRQLLLIELLKYDSLLSSRNWSHFLLHHPRVLPLLMVIWYFFIIKFHF